MSGGVADVVVYFQGAPSRRRRSVPGLLDQMEVPGTEVPAGVDDGALPAAVVREVEALVDAGLGGARLTREEATSAFLGISLSLFNRQLRNQDHQHVSLQRLYLLPDAFWRAFVLDLVERRQLATVQRRIEGL